MWNNTIRTIWEIIFETSFCTCRRAAVAVESYYPFSLPIYQLAKYLLIQIQNPIICISSIFYNVYIFILKFQHKFSRAVFISQIGRFSKISFHSSKYFNFDFSSWFSYWNNWDFKFEWRGNHHCEIESRTDLIKT